MTIVAHHHARPTGTSPEGGRVTRVVVGSLTHRRRPYHRRCSTARPSSAARAGAAASLYIDQYNVWMHHVLTEKGKGYGPAEGDIE